jgi:hypothetical protein
MIRKELQALLAEKKPRHSSRGTMIVFISGAALFSLWGFNQAKTKPLIEFVRLHYESGKIGQELIIHSDTPIPGKWSADINRGTTFLCGGEGRSPYEPRAKGSILWFTPDEWTHSTCPTLRPGDIISATWVCDFDGCPSTPSSGQLTIR